MDALKLTLLTLTFPLLTACQLGYYVSSGWNQMSLLSKRVPIEKALKDPTLTPEEKSKLELAQQAREFAENTLKLKPTKNYTSYVKLAKLRKFLLLKKKLELRSKKWLRIFIE